MSCGIGLIGLIVGFHCHAIPTYSSQPDLFRPVRFIESTASADQVPTETTRLSRVSNQPPANEDQPTGRSTVVSSDTHPDAMVFKFTSSHEAEKEKDTPKVVTPDEQAAPTDSSSLYQQMLAKARQAQKQGSDEGARHVANTDGTGYTMPPRPATQPDTSDHASTPDTSGQPPRQSLKAQVARLQQRNRMLRQSMQRLVRVIDRVTRSSGTKATGDAVPASETAPPDTGHPMADIDPSRVASQSASSTRNPENPIKQSADLFDVVASWPNASGVDDAVDELDSVGYSDHFISEHGSRYLLYLGRYGRWRRAENRVKDIQNHTGIAARIVAAR